VKSGQCLHRELGFLRGAARDLIALHGGRHISEYQDEVRTAVADIAVEASGDGDPYARGDVGVELDFRAVAEGDAIPDGIILGGQFDRESGRQVRIARVCRRHPVGGAGLSRADRGDLDLDDLGAKNRAEP
jgi:hypothetical protein